MGQKGQSGSSNRSRSNGSKPAVPATRVSSEYGVPLPSGYTALLRQPPMLALLAVQEKAQAQFPEPAMPLTTVTVAGKETTIPAGSDTPEFAAYLDALKVVQKQRNDWLLEFVFRRYLTIEELDSEGAWEQVMSAYRAEVETLREFADLDPDLSDRDVVLRYCLIRTPEEYSDIMAIAGMVVNMPDLTREEVLKRARSFRRDLAQ